MSRCFPFPPPGYEKKLRTEVSDLLKKAENKEKKHKKEKKDKERPKNKEKKERDGSDHKHRDKKDRTGKHKGKEKHRDKKNKEDRAKDTEKSSISEESTVAAKLPEKTRDELNPRVSSNDRSSISDEGKNISIFHGQPFQNKLPSQETKESKFVQELDRRIKADGTSRGSQLPVGVTELGKRIQETAARAAVRSCSGILAEEKIYANDKVDGRKMDVRGFKNEVVGNAMVHNHTTTSKSKIEGISKPVEEHKYRKWGGKQVCKEIGDDKPEDKRMDADKRSHGKEKDIEKKEKVAVKIESRKTDQDRPKHKGILVSVSTNKSSDLMKEFEHITTNDVNIHKRKAMSTNGALLESEIRPPKMLRPAHNHLMENGRKYEAHRIPTLSISDKDMVPNSVWLDNSEGLTNGIMEDQKPFTFKSKPSTATVLGDQITETSKPSLHNLAGLSKTLPVPMMENEITESSRKPAHPDSKYISELLTVPKLVVSPENGDEDWLFVKKVTSNELKFEPNVVEQSHVWSEAVHIKSADVCALPYVIPY